MDSHRLAQRLLAEENMEVSVSVDIGSDSNPDIRAFGEGLDEVAESGGFMNLCFADGSTNENTTLTHRISELEAALKEIAELSSCRMDEGSCIASSALTTNSKGE